MDNRDTDDRDTDDLETALARSEAREPVVAAFVARHPAERLRAEWATAPEGPLKGFTLGVKDIIDTCDLPTALGVRSQAARQPTVDAACVALARRAGVVVVAKTVTTELAMFSPGPTTNPHNPAHTPGGSSSGSAAAVAAGMVRVAFGTQTAGSMIRPASFCGVFGFKPTKDLVPMAGVNPVAASLDTLGWYGRSVYDVAAVLAALAPPNAANPAADEYAKPARLALYRSAEWEDRKSVV